jgi:GntR family transcriptional regulator of vanillate catabolism
MAKGRRSQFDKGLGELRSIVLSGDFAPHDRLSETMLADRLGISRTPLRQAIDRLVEEGLLERVESGGCRVARFTLADILDSIELRGVLEGMAVRLAAERGVSAELADQCKRVLDELNEAVFVPATPDFSSYVPLNQEFHDLMGRLCESSIVERELSRAYRLPVASPTAFLGGQELIPDFQESLRRAQRQHLNIFEAIMNREGTRAESLAREHARLARVNLEYITNENPKLAERIPGLALVDAA